MSGSENYRKEHYKKYTQLYCTTFILYKVLTSIFTVMKLVLYYFSTAAQNINYSVKINNNSYSLYFNELLQYSSATILYNTPSHILYVT